MVWGVIIVTLILTNILSVALFSHQRNNVAALEKQCNTLQISVKDHKKSLARFYDERPVCMCTHGINFHDEKTGDCSASTGKIEGILKDRDKPCKCRRYVGPEPLPTYYHPQQIGSGLK